MSRQFLQVIVSISMLGCASTSSVEKPREEAIVLGRVINVETGRTVSGITVEIFDDSPRLSLIGIASPIVLAKAKTDHTGSFRAAIPRRVRADELLVTFQKVPNVDAMESGLRVIDLEVKPTSSAN